MNTEKTTETKPIYISERQLADRWSLSCGSVKNWRLNGRGLPHLRIGKSVRYPLTAVESFETKGLFIPTSGESKYKWGLEWESN